MGELLYDSEKIEFSIVFFSIKFDTKMHRAENV